MKNKRKNKCDPSDSAVPGGTKRLTNSHHYRHLGSSKLTEATLFLNALMERESNLDDFAMVARRVHGISLDSKELEASEELLRAIEKLSLLHLYAEDGSQIAVYVIYRIAFLSCLALERIAVMRPDGLKALAATKTVWPQLVGGYDDFTRDRAKRLKDIRLSKGKTSDAFMKAYFGQFKLYSSNTKQAKATLLAGEAVSLIETVKQFFDRAESIAPDRIRNTKLVFEYLNPIINLSRVPGLWTGWIDLPELSSEPDALTKWKEAVRALAPKLRNGKLTSIPELAAIGEKRGEKHASGFGKPGSTDANVRSMIWRSLDRGVERLTTAPSLGDARRARSIKSVKKTDRT